MDELLLENETSRYEIVEMREKIMVLEDKITANEKIIWTTCDHVWKYDIGVDSRDRNKYFCTKCHLWRNSFMYQ